MAQSSTTVQSAPVCNFYGRLLDDIESIGWQRIVSISERLALDVQLEDVDRRRHIITIQLPPTYPETAPRVLVDMPLPFEPKWNGERSSLSDVVQQCETRLAMFLNVWRALDAIDQHCLVLDPSGVAPRATLARRIALGRHRTLSLVVDVNRESIRASFFGCC